MQRGVAWRHSRPTDLNPNGVRDIPGALTIRPLFNADSGLFGPEDIKPIVAAFEDTLRAMRLVDRSDPVVTLVANFPGENVNAGRIAARPCQAVDQTQLDRVFADAEHNRDRRGRGFGGDRRKGAGGCGDEGYT